MHRKIVRSLLVPAVFTTFPRCFASSESEKEKGLLAGFSDTENAKDFSRKINLKDACDLFKKDYLYNNAVKDD
jgi:hypothetical protein